MCGLQDGLGGAARDGAGPPVGLQQVAAEVWLAAAVDDLPVGAAPGVVVVGGRFWRDLRFGLGFAEQDIADRVATGRVWPIQALEEEVPVPPRDRSAQAEDAVLRAPPEGRLLIEHADGYAVAQTGHEGPVRELPISLLRVGAFLVVGEVPAAEPDPVLRTRRVG